MKKLISVLVVASVVAISAQLEAQAKDYSQINDFVKLSMIDSDEDRFIRKATVMLVDSSPKLPTYYAGMYCAAKSKGNSTTQAAQIVVNAIQAAADKSKTLSSQAKARAQVMHLYVARFSASYAEYHGCNKI